MSNWKEELKEVGQDITNHFFDCGARVGFSDYKFVKDKIYQLRLQDRDELIKMLPTKWEEIGFSECMGIVKQLIQDYYNK